MKDFQFFLAMFKAQKDIPRPYGWMAWANCGNLHDVGGQDNPICLENQAIHREKIICFLLLPQKL